MPKTQTVTIAEAKGRPMLHWVGKRPLDYIGGKRKWPAFTSHC
jgi:hypothetical protein